jgi:K+-transporting ATPase KdpF subunit
MRLEAQMGLLLTAQGIEYLLTGLVALGIGVYLMIALLRPDKF